MEKSSSFRENTDDDNNGVTPQNGSPHTEITPEDTNQKETPPESPHTHILTLSQASEFLEKFLLQLPEEHNLHETEIPSSLESFPAMVESLLSSYDSGKHNFGSPSSEKEDSLLLHATSLATKLTNTTIHPSTIFNSFTLLLQRLMTFLEDELRTLLEETTYPKHNNNSSLKSKSSFTTANESDRCALPSEPGSAKREFPSYSADSISSMEKLASAMIASGYEPECCQVYATARRKHIMDALGELGLERIGIDELHRMQWESLETETATWIKAVKFCAEVLFPGERRLCNSVFGENTHVCRALLNSLVRAVVIQLLNFAEAMAMTKRSTEKLFKFLDMYETLRELVAAIEAEMGEGGGEYSSELKSETAAAGGRLGEAAVWMFCDLENSIKSDKGKTPVSSGAVHPLTSYTMNYLKLACEYRETLEEVFMEHRRSGEEEENMTVSPFGAELGAVMELLDRNLEGKAWLYKDQALRSIFLMNNGRYILQKIKGCGEMHKVMGDGWCRKRSSELRQHHSNYKRETWGKVLDCLRAEGMTVNGKVAKPVVKERLKAFNIMFEEIHRTQSGWVVKEEQLQSELRVSIASMVIPAYRSFLGRFQQCLDPGRQSEKYVKMQPDDIETAIEELFEGNPVSLTRRR